MNLDSLSESVREGILFVLGNPLLDISAEVDEDFLKKYELEANNAILADEKHRAMYDDMVEKYSVEYVPGGAAQNTARTAQWLIGVPRSVTFVGCIGRDKYGEILEKKAKEAGVHPVYQYTDKEPTGTCAVLVSDEGRNRSLCAYLAAANHFSKSHLEIPENRKLMEHAQFFYISGFPLTVCPPAMLEVAKYASTHNKTFVFNLSAPFLCTAFKDPMMEVMPYVDILFGNETEAVTFAKEHNFGTEDLHEIAKKLAALPKHNGARARIVVITQGADNTIAFKDGDLKEYPVVPIKPENIIDTNGAGDAFVGGFLSQYCQGHTFEDCIRGANYAANMILQLSGCSLPEKHNFKLTVI
jgi:adenosine kinase